MENIFINQLNDISMFINNDTYKIVAFRTIKKLPYEEDEDVIKYTSTDLFNMGVLSCKTDDSDWKIFAYECNKRRLYITDDPILTPDGEYIRIDLAYK